MKVNFRSKDGLKVTADYYEAKNQKGFILLCHRSHFNRGEYKEIAPKLVTLGFSCLAIDQRSGMNVLGYINGTSSLAKIRKLKTGYLDAKQDIDASIDFAFKKNQSKRILAVGSSYSASILLLLSTCSEKIKALCVFSPGEYLKNVDLANSIKNISVPIFATSAKKEIPNTKKVLRFVDKKIVTCFSPKKEGAHGARALWEKSDGNEEYWKALENFLERIDVKDKQ